MPVGVFHRPAFCTVLFYARPQSVGCLRLWGSRLFRRSVRIELPADVTDLLSHYDHVRLLFAVPNAIEGVTVARPGTDSTFYMLDGRRTQGLPKKPGIYVRDGKKVLLR